jgi:hypothetical protein
MLRHGRSKINGTDVTEASVIVGERKIEMAHPSLHLDTDRPV